MLFTTKKNKIATGKMNSQAVMKELLGLLCHVKLILMNNLVENILTVIQKGVMS